MSDNGDPDDNDDDDDISSSSTADTLSPGDPIAEIIGPSDEGASPSNQQAQAPTDFSPSPSLGSSAAETDAAAGEQSASPSAASWSGNLTDAQLPSFLAPPDDSIAASGSDFVNGFTAVQYLFFSSLKDSIPDEVLQGFAATVAASGVRILPLADDEADVTLFVDSNGNALGRGEFTQDGQKIIHSVTGHVDDQGQFIPHVVADYNTATGLSSGRVIGVDGSSVPFSEQNGIPLDAPGFPEGFLPVVNSGSPSTISATPPLRPERDPRGDDAGMRPSLSLLPQSGVPIERAQDSRMEKDPGPDWKQTPPSPPSDGPTISAISDEDALRMQDSQILSLDLDPDVAFPSTPEARWPYAILYDVKQNIYLPLKDWFSDQMGTREPFRYIGSNGNLVETPSQKNHIDALGALFRIGSMVSTPGILGRAEVGAATEIFEQAGAGGATTAVPKMAESVSEVFQTLAKFRDEELAMMQEMYPEFQGAGRVDPSLGIGGANRATWFGNILNERVRQRVAYSIGEGSLTADLRWTLQGQRGVDFWLPDGTGFDLFPATQSNLLGHEASYLGSVQSDGTTIKDILPLLYDRGWL